MSELLCYKCLTEIEWADDNTPYCPNDKCDVEDGVYKDKTNLLKFGKNSIVSNYPINAEWYNKCVMRASREDYIIKEWTEKCSYWQHKYYKTFDYHVIERVKSLIGSIKLFINKKPKIYKITDKIK